MSLDIHILHGHILCGFTLGRDVTLSLHYAEEVVQPLCRYPHREVSVSVLRVVGIIIIHIGAFDISLVGIHGPLQVLGKDVKIIHIHRDICVSYDLAPLVLHIRLCHRLGRSGHRSLLRHGLLVVAIQLSGCIGCHEVVGSLVASRIVCRALRRSL